MGKSICLVGLVLLITHTLSAQDEGAIVKRERIDLSEGMFIGIGPSFTLGKNIGDYSTGINIEAGYVKRLNRVFSIGPSLSFVSFNYDPEKTKAENAADLYTGRANDINDWHERFDAGGLPPNQQWDYGYLLNLEGGNISMFSLALNLKINFIPVTNNSKFSVYGFAKPFIASAKRGDVSGVGTRYIYEAYEDFENDQLYYDTADDTWYVDEDADGVDNTDKWGPGADFPALSSEKKITGGIFVGPGIEVMPGRKFSFYGQVAFGYTLPISYVSTESFPKTITSYLDPKFPIVEKGFPSVNIQLGASLNF